MRFKSRRGFVLYLQIATAVVSLLLGLAQMTKESQPLVRQIRDNQYQASVQRQQELAQKRAGEISQMQISWQFRGHDGTWRYYSDSSSRYWARVNIQGVYEYCENPQYQLAVHPTVIR